MGSIEAAVEIDSSSSGTDSIHLTTDQQRAIGVLTGSRVVVKSPDGEQLVARVWQGDSEYVRLTPEQANVLDINSNEVVSITQVSDDVSSGSSVDDEVNQLQAKSNPVEDVDAEKTEEIPEDSAGNVQYEDIGGLDNELTDIREMIELPLSEPDLFDDYGVEPPRGVLLYGPPGTGKTLIARAIAYEADARFFQVDGPELVSKYRGESEKRLRAVFERARENGPSIIFFDEIDSFGSERDEGDEAGSRLVGQLLSLMDGVQKDEDVVVVGATNRVDSLDPALRRGGRFDREIKIGVPDEVGRQEILEIHTEDMPLGDDVSLEKLASVTHGFVGADLASLCREAGMIALTEYSETDGSGERVVEMGDFMTALSHIEPSAMREFVTESPDVTFDEVGGLDDAKQELIELVEWPVSNPELFESSGINPPAGVLLHGGTGTGKTLLARSLAGETDVNFISVNATELMNQYIGKSEETIRELFQRARQSAPSILFIDELGAIAGVQSGERHEVTERVISQLLLELDAVSDTPTITVLTATDDISRLDQRLVQPSRFERTIELDHPNASGRREIIEVYSEDVSFENGDEDVEWLVEKTKALHGGHIESVIQQSVMDALRGVVDEHGLDDAAEEVDEIVVKREMLESALDSI